MGLDQEGREWTLKERWAKDDYFRENMIKEGRTIEDMETIHNGGTQKGTPQPMPYAERDDTYTGQTFVVTKQWDPKKGRTVPRKQSEGYHEAMTVMRAQTRSHCQYCNGKMRWILTPTEPWWQCNLCARYLGSFNRYSECAECHRFFLCNLCTRTQFSIPQQNR